MDYLATLEEVQRVIRESFTVADSSPAAVCRRIASSLEDADTMLEQALHAIRDDSPCESCGWRI